MEDFDYIIGTHPFDVRIRRADGKTSLGITVERRRAEWIAVFPNKMVEVDRDSLLSALITFWPKIAGPYAGFPASKFMMDLSMLAGYLPEGKIHFVRDGHEVSFRFTDHQVDLGSESVIPVEILLALGNVIASDAPAHLQTMWNRASSQTALPPFPLERMEDMTQPDWDRASETEWYARAVGQDVETYCRVAKWLHARQLAFAVGHPDHAEEPTQAEYDVRHAPSVTLSDAEIDAIYALSAPKLGFTLDEMHRDAVAGRNTSARDVTVFKRFFPRGSKADAARSVTD
ncbi:hypothetical protein [Rhizobium sp. BK176]|uniref:hypothetical protein n=1 Tax=Rhizobium sp. BK176 TaxID=2587071 RepID=UPI00216914C4|nr:hypothetical protein [Rhizobium sp. BK176]MCS4089728.1 hypothetical protein [Rhizobium sp. BK176]